MGFGLVIAVLGIGSTFAANIQINNDETSEFGQGVTQTVYCGSDQEVTIAPISAYVNTVESPTWRQPVFEGKTFRTVGTASFSALNTRSFSKSYTNDQTGELETTIGYFVKDRISTDYYTRSLGDIVSGRGIPPTGDYDTFVPQEQKDGAYGFYYYSSWTPGFTADTTEDKFELGGVRISGIPSECDGRDFIISAYGSGADPLELSDVLDAKEIVVYYRSTDSDPNWSFDRSGFSDSSACLECITVSSTSGSIKVLFTSAAGRLLADSVTKVVVETQEDVID
jgi:hypothetical protein